MGESCVNDALSTFSILSHRLLHFPLQSQLAAKERELREARSALCSLREDFAYNLKLIEERDAELVHYDAAYSQASRTADSTCSTLPVTCRRILIVAHSRFLSLD